MPMQNALITPMITAARKAPGMLPMPPTTTTTNTSDKYRQIHGQHRRLARDLDCAAEAGEKRAEREHAGEQPRLVHAQGAGHLAVLGSGAHQRAPARAREQQPQQDQHHRTEHDQEQVVLRKLPSRDFDRASQTRRARSEQILRPQAHKAKSRTIRTRAKVASSCSSSGAW